MNSNGFNFETVTAIAFCVYKISSATTVCTAVFISGDSPMCRNIKTLFNFEPPATEKEIREAALQFVRKLSGFTIPSKANEAVFMQAVTDIAATASTLIQSLTTSAEPRDREIEAEKAKARSAARFGTPQ
jgi:hypothetical protein